jgi:ubiquinone biosynthesis protein
MYAQLSRPDLSAAVLSELQRSRQAREQGNRLLVALTGVAAVALGVALWALIR